MATACKPASSTTLAKAATATLAVLLVVAAAQARFLTAGAEQHTAHTVVAPDLPKPQILFYPERGCQGLVEISEGCGCIPIPRTHAGYLLTFTDAGQKAVFYSGPRCSGREMAELTQNSCYCFTPPYHSVKLECSPVADNATAPDHGRAYGYLDTKPTLME